MSPPLRKSKSLPSEAMEEAGLRPAPPQRNYMQDKIRAWVSKKKRRYKEDGFDLDLAYVTPRIVAMGFPAVNVRVVLFWGHASLWSVSVDCRPRLVQIVRHVQRGGGSEMFRTQVEATYRNSAADVEQFFDWHHGVGNYKLYNLCAERTYPVDRFHGQFERYPFEDHNPPALGMMYFFCADVDELLSRSDKTVAAVHCKAGKGRTGVMICAYLVWAKEWESAEDALKYYGFARTNNQKGVTIPSQRRFVHYFKEALDLHEKRASRVELSQRSVQQPVVRDDRPSAWGEPRHVLKAMLEDSQKALAGIEVEDEDDDEVFDDDDDDANDDAGSPGPSQSPRQSPAVAVVQKSRPTSSSTWCSSPSSGAATSPGRRRHTSDDAPTSPSRRPLGRARQRSTLGDDEDEDDDDDDDAPTAPQAWTRELTLATLDDDAKSDDSCIVIREGRNQAADAPSTLARHGSDLAETAAAPGFAAVETLAASFEHLWRDGAPAFAGGAPTIRRAKTRLLNDDWNRRNRARVRGLRGVLPPPKLLAVNKIVLRKVRPNKTSAFRSATFEPKFTIFCQDFLYKSDELLACAGAKTSFKAPAAVVDLPVPNAIVVDEVCVVFYTSRHKKAFKFWFHTAFIHDNLLHLAKSELDGACKDKKHLKFDENFSIELHFTENFNS